jgi:hypothetical protein
MSIVPAEWTRMVTHLQAASVARDCMGDPTSPQVMRDEATVIYSRAADQIVADLITLRGSMVLGRITHFLARKERT